MAREVSTRAPKNLLFYNKMKAVVSKHPEIRWTSDGDYPIEIVRLKDEEIRGWEREDKYLADERLVNAATNEGWGEGWTKLSVLFIEKPQEIALKRPVEENDRMFELYLLARFGRWYVGIKTLVVET